jgi:lysozyme family protein
MRENFSIYVPGWIESQEGFVSQMGDDPGGLTVFGIASASNSEAVVKMKTMLDQGVSKDAIWAVAADVYLNKYWIPSGCDTHQWPWDLIMFDVAVNPGPGALATLINKAQNWEQLLLFRHVYWQGRCNRKWTNRGGWLNRTADLFKLVMGIK